MRDNEAYWKFDYYLKKDLSKGIVGSFLSPSDDNLLDYIVNPSNSNYLAGQIYQGETSVNVTPTAASFTCELWSLSLAGTKVDSLAVTVSVISSFSIWRIGQFDTFTVSCEYAPCRNQNYVGTIGQTTNELIIEDK